MRISAVVKELRFEDSDKKKALKFEDENKNKDLRRTETVSLEPQIRVASQHQNLLPASVTASIMSH